MFSSCGLGSFFLGGEWVIMGVCSVLLVPHAVVFSKPYLLSDWDLAIEHLNHTISNENAEIHD